MRRIPAWIAVGLMLALATAAAFAVIIARLPTAAACSASGRAVDYSGRYCVELDGRTSQLREHVLGHTAEALVLAVALGGVVALLRWAVRAAWRRRPRPSA